MADYYRQCPHCGGQTKEINCEICGRKTILTNHVYEDTTIAKNTTSKKVETKGETPGVGHIQKMMEEGRNYGKQMPVTPTFGKKQLITLLAIAIIIFPLLLILFLPDDSIEETHPDTYDDYDETYYDSIDAQYIYLQDYVVPTQSSTPLSCEVDETEADRYYIHNTTPYLFNVDVELKTKMGTDPSSIYQGSPYEYEYAYIDNDIQTCKIVNTEYNDLTLFKTDIIYEILYDDEYHREMLLQEEITQVELETLLKRIYCLNILTYHDYDEMMHVMIKDELVYDIEFDYENENISITDIESNDITLLKVSLGV